MTYKYIGGNLSIASLLSAQKSAAANLQLGLGQKQSVLDSVGGAQYYQNIYAGTTSEINDALSKLGYQNPNTPPAPGSPNSPIPSVNPADANSNDNSGTSINNPPSPLSPNPPNTTPGGSTDTNSNDSTYVAPTSGTGTDTSGTDLSNPTTLNQGTANALSGNSGSTGNPDNSLINGGSQPGSTFGGLTIVGGGGAPVPTLTIPAISGQSTLPATQGPLNITNLIQKPTFGTLQSMGTGALQNQALINKPSLFTGK